MSIEVTKEKVLEALFRDGKSTIRALDKDIPGFSKDQIWAAVSQLKTNGYVQERVEFSLTDKGKSYWRGHLEAYPTVENGMLCPICKKGTLRGFVGSSSLRCDGCGRLWVPDPTHVDVPDVTKSSYSVRHVPKATCPKCCTQTVGHLLDDDRPGSASFYICWSCHWVGQARVGEVSPGKRGAS